MLTGWGAQTKCTEGGKQALSELISAGKADQPYQLVLTDMHMPDMDGFGLVEQIRSSPKLSPVTVILLTSGGHGGEMERCRQLEILSYLYKPVRKRELLVAILTALGKRQITSPLSGARPTDQPPQSKRAHILLAEDNRTNQTVATRTLEKMGHSVVVVRNGNEALSVLATQSFDLILMDIQMPEMDGLTATMKIREKERSTQRHLPVIAMTAHAMKGDRERCLEAGMDGYVSKPINRTELEESIAIVLNGRDDTNPPASSLAFQGRTPRP
jgi:CheY-like chemotaxis protein